VAIGSENSEKDYLKGVKDYLKGSEKDSASKV